MTGYNHFLFAYFCFVAKMTFYCNDNWIAYLCEHIVRQSSQKCISDCPGCNDKLHSTILHLHEQLSLLDKLRKYFQEIRGSILHDIESYYTVFENKLPHSDDKKKDKLIYLNIARSFLITATSDSVYFGRYLDECNDGFINEAFTKKKAKK